MEKLPIPCKFCTYRFIRYSFTCYGKVRINPLMANIRNPDFFASPVANAVWFVVVRPCYLNRDLLSGPKGNWLDRFQAQFLRNWPVRAIAERKHYQKSTILIFRLALQNFAIPGCFPYILFYRYLFSSLSSCWFVIAACGYISVRELVKS